MPRLLELTAGTVDLERGVFEGPAATHPLTPTELRLLRYLAERPGDVVDADVLLREVWGYAAAARSRTVRTTIGRLRAKIERDPSEPDHLLTEYGAGYRLQLPQARPAGPVHVPASWVALEPRDELAEVDAALARGARLVTLVGPAGIGKTTLLKQVGRSHQAPSGGIWYVDASAVRSPDRLAALVLAALERPAAGRPPAEVVAEVLAERGPIELLLDDVDAIVVPAAALLARWLAAAPGLSLLVACREPLRVGGEARVRLRPLGAEASSRVLRRRLLDRGVAEPDDGDVARLVAALDGIPLALELAAAACDLHGVQPVVRSIEARLLALRTDRRDAPDRHTTLDAALWVSWERLDPVEQAALSQLAVFRGPVAPAHAEEVVQLDRWQAGVARTVARLADASLVQVAASRWRLLGATRAFVWQALPPAPDTVQRFVAWARDLPFRARESGAHVAALVSERDHVAEARRLAVEPADRAELDCTVAEIDTRLGAVAAAEDRLMAALAAAPDDLAGPRSKLATRLIALRAGRGVHGPAELALAHGAAADAERADNPRSAAIAWRHVAFLERPTHPERAIAALEHSLGFAEVADDEAFVAIPLAELGRLRLDLGPLDAARAPLERARRILAAVGHEGVGVLGLRLAELDARTGDVASARQRVEAARAATDPQAVQAMGALSTTAAMVARLAGDPAEALQHLGEAWDCARQADYAVMLTDIAGWQALCLLDLDRADEAVAALARAPQDHRTNQAIAGLVAASTGDGGGARATAEASSGPWRAGDVRARSLVAELHALAATAADRDAPSAWARAVEVAGPPGDRIAEGRAALGHALVVGGDAPRVPRVPELLALRALAEGRAPQPSVAARSLRVRLLGAARL